MGGPAFPRLSRLWAQSPLENNRRKLKLKHIEGKRQWKGEGLCEGSRETKKAAPKKNKEVIKTEAERKDWMEGGRSPKTWNLQRIRNSSDKA